MRRWLRSRKSEASRLAWVRGNDLAKLLILRASLELFVSMNLPCRGSDCPLIDFLSLILGGSLDLERGGDDYGRLRSDGASGLAT